jgi:hypothetical protein
MMNEEKKSDEVELLIYFVGENSKTNPLKVKVSEGKAKWFIDNYLMGGEELKGFYRFKEQAILINCSQISYICY